MNKWIFLVLISVVAFSALFYFWFYPHDSSGENTDTHQLHESKTTPFWEEKKYYTGDMPPRKTIPLLQLPPLNFKQITMYTIKTLKSNESLSCLEGEFIEFRSENGSDLKFACLNGTSGKIVEVPIEELWGLPENAAVYYSPLVIVRTPPPIKINGTEYTIGINALYYCDPAEKEMRVREMAFYYPASDRILRFAIPVNSSIIEEFKGRKVFYVLDVVDIENTTLVAKYSPWCISS